MLRAALFTTTLALLAAPALAQDYNPLEGIYIGSGEGELTLDLTHIEADRYKVDISTEVPMENDIPGCGGGIGGEMLFSETGGNFFVENEDYDGTAPEDIYNQRYCEIRLTFDDDGILTMEEQDGCMAYHGASCSFTGTLIHEGAAG